VERTDGRRQSFFLKIIVIALLVLKVFDYKPKKFDVNLSSIGEKIKKVFE
jgi:hypothetical protein